MRGRVLRIRKWSSMQMNLSMKQKQTHRHREQTCGCHEEHGGGMHWELGLADANYHIECPVINYYGKEY